MFYVFLHFFRSVLVRNLASVFVLPSDSRKHLFLVHCTWPRRACLEKTLIDGLLPSHAASSSPVWRGNARVIKPYEPSEWEDNEPAAKPQTTLVIRLPRFFCSPISILTKRWVALETKTSFLCCAWADQSPQSYLRRKWVKGRWRNDLRWSAMICDLSNVGKNRKAGRKGNALGLKALFVN